MTLDAFLLELLIVSILTGLTTEAIKKILEEHSKKYMANTLAGIVAIVLSLAVGIGYMIITKEAISAAMVIYIVALIFMSWLAAMVGYDKVIQAISQFKN